MYSVLQTGADCVCLLTRGNWQITGGEKHREASTRAISTMYAGMDWLWLSKWHPHGDAHHIKRTGILHSVFRNNTPVNLAARSTHVVSDLEHELGRPHEPEDRLELEDKCVMHQQESSELFTKSMRVD